MLIGNKLLWILKENEQFWDGAYFLEIILQKHVIPFLLNPINALDTNEVALLHYKAPSMKANATYHVLEDEGVNFSGNSIWPGNSPDMNPTENIDAVIKDKVEELMTSEDRRDRYNLMLSKPSSRIHSRILKMKQIFLLICCVPWRKYLMLSKLPGKVIPGVTIKRWSPG